MYATADNGRRTDGQFRPREDTVNIVWRCSGPVNSRYAAATSTRHAWNEWHVTDRQTDGQTEVLWDACTERFTVLVWVHFSHLLVIERHAHVRTLTQAIQLWVWTWHSTMHHIDVLTTLSLRILTFFFYFRTLLFVGPFYGAIAVPSVTRCRCRCCCRGHRCAGAVRQ